MGIDCLTARLPRQPRCPGLPTLPGWTLEAARPLNCQVVGCQPVHLHTSNGAEPVKWQQKRTSAHVMKAGGSDQTKCSLVIRHSGLPTWLAVRTVQLLTCCPTSDIDVQGVQRVQGAVGVEKRRHDLWAHIVRPVQEVWSAKWRKRLVIRRIAGAREEHAGARISSNIRRPLSAGSLTANARL